MTVFDIIGPVMIGPSSSHTAGAARLGQIARKILGAPAVRAEITLCGSFAQTYRGHGTDKAVLLGLEGHWPDRVDPDAIGAIIARVRETLKGREPVVLSPGEAVDIPCLERPDPVAVDAALEGAPVDAIAGVSEEDAKKLEKLKVKTIADFAGLDSSKLTPKDVEVLGACFNVKDAPGLDALKFYKWAKAIVLFSAAEK